MKDFYGLIEKKIKNGLAECGYVVDNVQVNESNRRDLAEYQSDFFYIFLLSSLYHYIDIQPNLFG